MASAPKGTGRGMAGAEDEEGGAAPRLPDTGEGEGEAARAMRKRHQGGDALGIKLIVSYGLGHVLNDLAASMWFFYIVLYIQQVLELSQKNTGILVLVGQVVDGLWTPVVGFGSDRTQSWMGRRKPWYLFGVICVVFSFTLVFGGCLPGATPDNFLKSFCILGPWNGASKRSITLLVVFIALFQIGWASSQVSHLALIPDLSRSKRQTTTLSAVRYGVTVTCNICVLVALWLLLDLRTQGGSVKTCNVRLQKEDQPTFQYLSWGVTGIGVVCATFFLTGIPNRPEQANKAKLRDGDVGAKWNFFQEEMFWKTGLLYMLTRLIININMVYIPLYVQNTMQMPKASIAIIPLLMYIFSLLGSAVQRKLNEKFGRVLAFSTGVLLQLVSSVVIYFLPRHLSMLLYFTVPMTGLAGTTLMVTVSSMTSDLIGDRKGASAKIFGIYSFTDKVSTGAAIYVIQNAMRCTNCCKQTECCGSFYRIILGLVPMGGALMSLVIILVSKHRKARRLARSESQALLDPMANNNGANATTYGATQ